MIFVRRTCIGLDLRLLPKYTLAEANEKKDWRIYQDFGYVLIQKAKKLYEGEKLRIDLDEMVCAFDSSTIELCLALCPWATLHHGKGSFKMHTLMDLKGSIPIFIRLTEASIHDSKVMNEIPVVTNAYYLMDKGYVKFDSLYKHFHQNHAWFVTRAKDNMLCIVTESREVDTKTGLISDETIQLTGFYTSQKYPDSLRLIVYEDFRDGKVYRFLTNNFSIDAITVAELYRERWQI